MMPHGGHWGAPSVIAAFAGLVHDRESTANCERNDDYYSYYGSVHCNLPARPKKVGVSSDHPEYRPRAFVRAPSPSAMGF
jgi:hypothetical protein